LFADLFVSSIIELSISTTFNSHTSLMGRDLKWLKFLLNLIIIHRLEVEI